MIAVKCNDCYRIWAMSRFDEPVIACPYCGDTWAFSIRDLPHDLGATVMVQAAILFEREEHRTEQG